MQRLQLLKSKGHCDATAIRPPHDLRSTSVCRMGVARKSLGGRIAMVS